MRTSLLQGLVLVLTGTGTVMLGVACPSVIAQTTAVPTAAGAALPARATQGEAIIAPIRRIHPGKAAAEARQKAKDKAKVTAADKAVPVAAVAAAKAPPAPKASARPKASAPPKVVVYSGAGKNAAGAVSAERPKVP